VGLIEVKDDYKFLPVFDKHGDMYTSLKYKWKIIGQKHDKKKTKYEDPTLKVKQFREKVKKSALYSYN